MAWMAWVATLQLLSPVFLAIALSGCALAGVWLARSRCIRLVRRVRFLIVAIFVLFAGFTPGEAIWPAVQSLSPSREGMVLAVEHVGRLLAVVLCVALLLERLSLSRLVGGLYALLRPFHRIGLPAEALAVRLMLVLRYVESAPPGAWREWLEDSPEVGAAGCEAIVIGRERLGRRDGALLLALGALVLLAVWQAGARS